MPQGNVHSQFQHRQASEFYEPELTIMTAHTHSCHVIDTAGLVGLRIRNAGYNLSVVDEIRVLDDSGMLKTDKLYQKRTTGQVHFQRDRVAESIALSDDPHLGKWCLDDG